MQATDIVRLVSAILLTCSGIFFNVCVTFSSFRAWYKDGFQGSQDLIVFIMGLSCTVFSSFQFSMDMSSYIWESMFQSLNLCVVVISSIYIFTIFFTLSMTAWLCLFYCVKIVHLRHRLFIAIKSRFLANLPRLIAVTFVISSILPISMFCVPFTFIPTENPDNSTIYCPNINGTLVENFNFLINVLNLFIAGLFLLILLSLGSTVTSLVCHVCRMQLSSNLNNSNVKALLNAAKIMTLLLFLNVSFYLSYVILYLNVEIESDFLNLIIILIYYSFWPLQALVLLFRHPKSSLVAFMCSCRCPST